MSILWSLTRTQNCIAKKPLVPVYHMGAAMGWPVPYWDARDGFGDTSLLVTKPEEGRSLARARSGKAGPC